MVQEKMPGFRLTPAITGRSVTPAPGFAIETIDNRDSRDEAVTKFLKGSEKTGLSPSTIYFPIGFRPNDYWRVNFPGCAPGACLQTLPNLAFQKTSKSVTHRYYPLRTGVQSKFQPVLQRVVNGVGYEAKVFVSYDFRGRVLRYRLYISRQTISDAERAWVRSAQRTRQAFPVLVYLYSHNPVLGVSKLHDDGPFIVAESEKGL
ncbi:MAG: hypothetical protein N4A53_01885 [Pelagimonas sp.]|jgi:hypothetical protein|nr:hypothetical protein [Pelagimonas sp.]